MFKLYISILFLFSLAQVESFASQDIGFNRDKIRSSLSHLLAHKEYLIKGSVFGQHEILFFNPVSNEGFVAETTGNS
jgi:hypothetical protein